MILVTGTNSGMDFKTAKTLAQQGNKVYGAARRVEKMAALKEYGVTPLKLDITDETLNKAAIAEIIAKEGRLMSWLTMQAVAVMARLKTLVWQRPSVNLTLTCLAWQL